VPSLKTLRPWYLVTTDLDLTPLEAVQAYDRRQQIEVNFDEVKELGLGHYQERSGEGVRRWPVFLCIAQTLLKLIATNVFPSSYPRSTGHGRGWKTQLGKFDDARLRRAVLLFLATPALDPTEKELKKAA
jgi:hypothetical protein